MMPFLPIAFQTGDPNIDSATTVMVLCLVLFLIVWMIVYMVGLAKIFQKAERSPGWVFVPVVNFLILLDIAGRSRWWMLAFIALNVLAYYVPEANNAIIALSLYIFLGLSRSFGHNWGYALGLTMLQPIFIPLLGFGDSQYDPDGEGVHQRKRQKRKNDDHLHYGY